MIVKCACQHCNGSIEFESLDLVEQNSIIACPHCSLKTRLFIPPAPAPKKQPTINTGIYLQVQGEQRGPYARCQIDAMWNSGVITLDALYWYDGMSDWEAISNLIPEVAKPTAIANGMNSGAHLANLLELAKAAADAGNPSEAYDYFTQALELDPSNPSIWAGKAESVGWMSTIVQIRTVEMISAFNNAINYAPEQDKVRFKKYAADVVNRVTASCFGMARRHLLRFGRVSETWPNYVQQCGLLISTLEAGHLYDPDNKKTIENIIHICKDNIQGYSYSPDGIGLLSKKFFVKPEHEANLRTKIKEYAARMCRLDPTFVAPQL